MTKSILDNGCPDARMPGCPESLGLIRPASNMEQIENLATLDAQAQKVVGD